MATGADTVEQAIQTLLEERAAAVRSGDLDRLMTVVAPDAVLYDALATLQRTGRTAIREKTNEWLSGYTGPIGYEIRNLQILSGGDVAVCHYLYRITGTMQDGQQVDMWLRSTLGLIHRDGAWTIVHEHTSVPFDAASGSALLDLTP